MGTKMGMCQLTKTSKRKEGSIPSFIKMKITLSLCEGEHPSTFKASKLLMAFTSDDLWLSFSILIMETIIVFKQ